MSVAPNSLDTNKALQHFGYIPATQSGGRNSYKCPLHKEEKGHSLHVFETPERGWYCFGRCQTGGNAIRFISLHENVPYGAAVRIAEQIYGVKIEYDRRKEQHAELYKVNAEFAELWHANLLKRQDLLTYLALKRGIPLETVKEWKIGYASGQDDLPDDPARYPSLLAAGILSAPKGDRYVPAFIDRIVIPILDGEGDVIGFSGRQNPLTHLPPEKADRIPKWKNTAETPIFQKRQAIIGLRRELYSQIKEFGGIVVVEGGFDAVVPQRFGIPTVAIMGLGTHMEWLETMWRYTKRVILFLDGDDAGYDNVFRMAKQTLFPAIDAKSDAEIRVAFPPPGKDPDEYVMENADECKLVLKNAPAIEDYVTGKMIEDALKLDSFADRRALLFQKYGDVLAALPRLNAKAYLRRIGAKTEVDVEDAVAALRSTLAQNRNFARARQSAPASRQAVRPSQPADRADSARTEAAPPPPNDVPLSFDDVSGDDMPPPPDEDAMYASAKHGETPAAANSAASQPARKSAPGSRPARQPARKSAPGSRPARQPAKPGQTLLRVFPTIYLVKSRPDLLAQANAVLRDCELIELTPLERQPGETINGALTWDAIRLSFVSEYLRMLTANQAYLPEGADTIEKRARLWSKAGGFQLPEGMA